MQKLTFKLITLVVVSTLNLTCKMQQTSFIPKNNAIPPNFNKEVEGTWQLTNCLTFSTVLRISRSTIKNLAKDGIFVRDTIVEKNDTGFVMLNFVFRDSCVFLKFDGKDVTLLSQESQTDTCVYKGIYDISDNGNINYIYIPWDLKRRHYTKRISPAIFNQYFYLNSHNVMKDNGCKNLSKVSFFRRMFFRINDYKIDNNLLILRKKSDGVFLAELIFRKVN